MFVMCLECKDKLLCIESASDNEATYRKYRCPVCRNITYTTERADKTARYELNALRLKRKKQLIREKTTGSGNVKRGKTDGYI